MAQRAHALEDKQAKRAAILHVASKLFNAGNGALPTSSEIAATTGLAKGTIYLYFRTKEEIFAALLLEGWTPILDATDTVFSAANEKQADKVAAFITNL